MRKTQNWSFNTQCYAAAVRFVDDMERRDPRCFNCRETQHMWRNCPKPLKVELKHIKERVEQWQDQLNVKGAPEPREAKSPKESQHRC